MEIYTSDVNNAEISKIPNTIRDDKNEHRWANFILKLKYSKHNDLICEWGFGCTYYNKPCRLNYYNFADAANMDIIKIKEILKRLYSFTYSADKVHFVLNWNKTYILLSKITPKLKNYIESLPDPYNKINIVTKENVP